MVSSLSIVLRGLQLCFIITLSTASSSDSTIDIPRVSRPYAAQVYAIYDSEVSIPCPVTGAQFVEWFKDGEPIIETGDIRVKSSGEFDLMIGQVKYEDRGVYSCHPVSGYGGGPRLNFTLFVLELGQSTPPPGSQTLINPGEKPPTFVEDPPGPKEHRLEPGAGPKLRCRAEGNPRPEITWYKDGIPIRNSENALVEGFSLKLYNLQESDEGRYMCRVFNKLGSINFTYSITVIDRQTTAEVVPPYPMNASVSFGSPASLQCRVKSKSPPIIRWWRQVPEPQSGSTTFNNEHYIVVKNETSVIETEAGTYLNALYIPKVRYEDAGKYICSGVNQRGGSDLKEAFIKVVPNVMSTTSQVNEQEEAESSWEYIFGSPSATLAVLISIPVVLILIIIIAIIYGMNKRKKNTSIRRPPNPMLHEHEASVPLNINGNNASMNGQYGKKVSLSNGGENYYTEPMYHTSPYYKNQVPQQYSQYSQSDGSYRSGLMYPPLVPNHNQYIADIPDSDSHFSSVSHSRPQYMPNPTQYERDVQSDPPLSRMSHHHCPPPPPGSYYSGQW